MVPSEKGSKTSAFFSATFPVEVQTIGAELLDDYVFMAVGIVGGANADVEQQFYHLNKNEKIEKVNLKKNINFIFLQIDVYEINSILFRKILLIF
jgi:superfamily II DNA/RNA helicase